MNTQRMIGMAALALSGALVVAGGTPAAAYTSRQGYEITPPPGWRVGSQHPIMDAIFAAAPVNGFAPNITIVVMKGKTSGTEANALRDGLAEIRKGYPRMFSDYNELDAGYTILGGRKGISITAKYSAGPAAVPLEMHQVAFQRDKRVYTFTCTAGVDAYTDYLPAFVACLRSIHWTAPGRGR